MHLSRGTHRGTRHLARRLESDVRHRLRGRIHRHGVCYWAVPRRVLRLAGATFVQEF